MSFSFPHRFPSRVPQPSALLENVAPHFILAALSLAPSFSFSEVSFLMHLFCLFPSLACPENKNDSSGGAFPSSSGSLLFFLPLLGKCIPDGSSRIPPETAICLSQSSRGVSPFSDGEFFTIREKKFWEISAVSLLIVSLVPPLPSLSAMSGVVCR